MRPAPIVIQGLDDLAARAEWGQRKYGLPTASRRRSAPEPVVFRNYAGRRVNRPALQGYAALYDEPFWKDGRIVVFDRACFRSSINREEHHKELWIDHDPGKVVGVTGLEFANTLDGLAFRFPLDSDSATAGAIRDCLDDSKKACVSVGCRIEESNFTKSGSTDVEWVLKAKLEEVSLVKQGAVPETFVALVDLDDCEPDLWSEARSSRFRTEKIHANISAKVRRICDGLQSLR
jgi:HK97 family phage prohead protease